MFHRSRAPRSSNERALFDVLGWCGVVAILGAYALLAFDILTSHDGIYQLLNLSGALALGAEAYTKRDMQPAVLNVLWALIALVALVGGLQ